MSPVSPVVPTLVHGSSLSLRFQLYFKFNFLSTPRYLFHFHISPPKMATSGGEAFEPSKKPSSFSWNNIKLIRWLGKRKLKVAPIEILITEAGRDVESIHSRRRAASVAAHDPKFFCVKHELIFWAAEACFTTLSRLCGALCIVEFKQNASGGYVRFSRPRRWIHYGMLAMLNLSMLHKLAVTAERILFEELNAITFMCISGTLVYFVPWCLSLGITLKWKETMDLLNSWPMILACLETRQQRGPKRKTQFGNLSLALKLSAVAVMVPIVVFAAASLSILFKNLPVCLLPLAKGVGIVPEQGMLPHFMWQLIFFPLEVAVAVPPLTATGFSAGIVFISVGVFKIYLDQIR